jgi:dTMP kinase
MSSTLHRPDGAGIFITVEGPDGSGKSTQLDLLVAWLRTRGRTVVLTREPGGTPAGEAIRAILLDPKRHAALADETELFLFAAGRAQHVRECVLPALCRGAIVIASRYADATEAYQGFGRGLSLELVQQVNAAATGGIMPDLTIILDINTEEGLRRARATDKETPCGDMDRIEAAGIAFHQRVRDGYLTIARREPARCVVIDGAAPIDIVAQAIRACVTRRFGL